MAGYTVVTLEQGWDPYVLGWAHDGSGVYVHFIVSGLAAQVLIPYMPLFKLSPISAAEERWRLATGIAVWLAGLAAVGGAGWWYLRRRRRVG
jgi:hypothetical protein